MTQQDVRLSREYQSAVRDMVAQHVYKNVGQLMTYLFEATRETRSLFDEEIESMIEGTSEFGDNGIEIGTCVNCEEEDVEIDKEQQTCETCYQPETYEILEYWVVSSWFGEQLQQRYEKVRKIFGLSIWGRSTSGQAIALDDVVCDIYDAHYLSDKEAT